MSYVVTILNDLQDKIGPDISEEWWAPRREAIEAEERLGRLRVPVVGHFNAGKSTLVNALINEELMPRDAVPTSGVVSEVEAGDQRGFFVVKGHQDYLGGEEKPVDIDTFKKMARGGEAAGDHTLIRAYLPTFSFPERVVLADTPGVDSLERVHTAITYGYLAASDAVVMVTDGTKGGLQDGHVRFLRDQVLKRTLDHLLVAITKLDGLPEGQRESVVTKVRDQLSNSCGVKSPIVLSVDAAGALEDRLNGGDGSAYGLGDLRLALDDRFLSSAGKLRQEKARAAMRLLVAEAVAVLTSRAESLELNIGELENRLQELAAQRQKASESRHLLTMRVRDGSVRIRAGLKVEVRRRLLRLADKAPGYVAELQAAPDDHDRISARIRGDLAKEIEGLGSVWLKPQIEKLVGALQDDMAELSPNISDLAVKTPGVPGEVVLDVLVEGGLLVLLNVMLPGEWLVALVTRVLGKSGLDRAVEGVKKVVAQLVGQLLAGVIRSRLESAISSAILGMEDELTANLCEEVETLMKRVEGQLVLRLDSEFDELVAGTEQALRDRQEGEGQARAEQTRLLSVIESVQRLSEESLGTTA